MNCWKCKARMEKGFIADHADAGRTFATFWYSGIFERSEWGVDMANRRAFVVESWRCTGCGYLESFARVQAEG